MNPKDYDKQVNWDRRLANEWPFYRELFERHRVSSILDCGCGTGRHAIFFSARGFEVTGTDIDPLMIARARENAEREKSSAHFQVAAFSDLSRVFPTRRFDAVICVGNSLSLLPDMAAVQDSIVNFAAVCRSTGLLVLHILNYHSLLTKEMVAQPLRIAGTQDRREFFQKIFLPRRSQVDIITVHLVDAGGEWSSEVSRGKLLPIEGDILDDLMLKAGFADVTKRGDYAGQTYEKGSSWDLIITAARTC